VLGFNVIQLVQEFWIRNLHPIDYLALPIGLRKGEIAQRVPTVARKRR